MPVASEDWVAHPPKIPNSIASSITTVKGATIQNTATIQSNTTAWMSPGVVILEGCRPPAATTARRFLRWFSRLGQPPIGKSAY
uniref:Uncharacterized protein n=1 Tax=Vespula pensylvanica TaxID=30213 RepID=A0A834P9S4_VESPE|nr:hypothetical protein H0235_002505 [Vespula pensylvanica]